MARTTKTKKPRWEPPAHQREAYEYIASWLADLLMADIHAGKIKIGPEHTETDQDKKPAELGMGPDGDQGRRNKAVKGKRKGKAPQGRTRRPPRRSKGPATG